MKHILEIKKNIGETPLEALENVRIREGIPLDVPMTYAGRLDPMAEGVLLVLVGDECKNKDKYLGLDKEYEVEILFGFATDTHDVLGKVVSHKSQVESEIQIEDVKNELQKFKSKFVQEYPAYSSKTVDGVQLHVLANKGELPDEMPTKEMEIYDIQILEERELRGDVLLEEIKNKISKVRGDFRQEEIINLWQSVLGGSDYLEYAFKIVKVKVFCSSGTYMRSLAHSLGKNLGIPALAYSIKRVKVGDYRISNI